MNPTFKLRFDQMRDSAPTERPDADKIDDQVGDTTSYETAGHVRNLCLGWPDGRRMFLNYAYLVACEYEPGDEKNSIRLNFSSHTVTLNGYGLETLFIALLDHLPRLIMAVDDRYALNTERLEAVLTAIIVENKEP